jgi:hypothetical protein
MFGQPTLRRACVAAVLLVLGVPQMGRAQNDAAKKNPPPAAVQAGGGPAANPALARLPRNAQRTLATYRRTIGRQLRGGADDFYVIVAGEVVDTPREPNLLDLLNVVATGTAIMWDLMIFPAVIASGGEAADLLITDTGIPSGGPAIERKHKTEVHVIQGKVAAIQFVFDHTTATVGQPPDPKRKVYRGWAQGGTVRTKEAALERKAQIEKLANPPPAEVQAHDVILAGLKKLLDPKPALNPPEEDKEKAKP